MIHWLRPCTKCSRICKNPCCAVYAAPCVTHVNSCYLEVQSTVQLDLLPSMLRDCHANRIQIIACITNQSHNIYYICSLLELCQYARCNQVSPAKSQTVCTIKKIMLSSLHCLRKNVHYAKVFCIIPWTEKLFSRNKVEPLWIFNNLGYYLKSSSVVELQRYRFACGNIGFSIRSTNILGLSRSQRILIL